MRNKQPIQLTSEQLEELMKRYYLGEKVADLIEAFQLDIPLSGLVRMFPLQTLVDLLCPYCDKPMSQRYPSRSALNANNRISKPFCKTCGHIEEENCLCDSCRTIREIKEELQLIRYQQQISQIQNEKTICSSKLNELTLRNSFFLVGLCRAGRDEDSNLLASIQSHHLQFAPTQLMSIDIVESLYKDHLIEISMTSPPDSIIFSDTGISQIIWDEVEWRLRLDADETSNITLIENLEIMLCNTDLWPDSWESELVSLWKELALHECLRYLQVQLETHGFEFCAGKKTKQVINDILIKYPILKCFYFIWVSVRSAASYYMQNNTSRRQASNIVTGNMQRRAEQALFEGWEIKEYKKDTRCGESILTALFSNVLTNLGDDFFKAIPGDRTLDIVACNKNP
jgi:hypothetical protein